MILYTFLEKTIGKIDPMQPILGPNPNRFAMRWEMLWLGALSERVEIAIRESRTALSWLYSDANLVYFSYAEQLYECSLTELKELAENKIMQNGRKFVDEPELYCMRRDDGGRIVMWLTVYDVLEISERVVIKE